MERISGVLRHGEIDEDFDLLEGDPGGLRQRFLLRSGIAQSSREEGLALRARVSQKETLMTEV